MITILMATYNGERFIAEQIESILEQTETNWQLIIQDDCSKDITPKIAQSYAMKYPSKIRFLQRQTPSGSAKNNFSSMLHYADSEYTMFCDQDDVWLPGKIEITLKEMLQMESTYGMNTPILVHTDLKVVDEALSVQSESMFRRQSLDSTKDAFNRLLVQNIVTGCSSMVNRALLEKAQKVPEKAIMHDWWLALVAAAFGRIGFISQTTVLYRQHSGNDTGAKDARSVEYNLKRLINFQQARQTLKNTYEQAEAFRRLYGEKLTPALNKVLLAYIGLSGYGKLKRLHTINRYDFWKTGIARKAGQFLFT